MGTRASPSTPALAIHRGAWIGLFVLACSGGADEEAAQSAPRLDAVEQARLEQLLALGYVEGSQEATGPTGVTLYRRGHVSPGWNLLVSGHGPEALLFDMDGRVLHRWHYPFARAWPGRRDDTWYRGHRYWRRAHLFETGDLLAIFDGIGLIKIDRHSELLWKYSGRAHHDLDVLEDGSIYTLIRVRRSLPELGAEEPVDDDFIVELDAEGNERRRVSIHDSLRRSDYASWLAAARSKGDIFHTNTIEVLDGRFADRSAHFREGNVLISIHALHAVAVVDLDAGRVVWAIRGSWAFQHQPTFLDNGHLLLFDNAGTRNRSSVLEIDPLSGREVWRFQEPEENAFYTFCCGSAQRLADGNTLVTESERGRAFEVTREGEIVWEYRSPLRAGKEDELVATLYELVRLPSDWPLSWLHAPPAGGAEHGSRAPSERPLRPGHAVDQSSAATRRRSPE